MEIVAGELELYTDELLVSDGKRGEGEDSKDTDINGLTPTVLEARSEQRVAVHEG